MTEATSGSYVGWTVAAMNFRRLMRQRAVAPVSLLLMGEPGTGKRRMAEAWRQASGANDLPIVDLDRSPADIPDRCIAITTRPIRSRHVDQQPIDLGTRIPVADCKLDGEPIPVGLLSRFAIKLLVPPLRERRMDILAATHWHASQLSPGNRSILMSSRLIYRMFLDATWTTNEQGLTDFLVLVFTSATRRKEDIVMQDGDLDLWNPSGPEERLWHTNQLLPMIRPGEQVASLGTRRSDWTCDDVDVPIDRLPMVAIAILFYGFWKSLDEDDADELPRYVLGNDWRWISDTVFPSCHFTSLAGTPASELFQEWNWGLQFDDAVVQEMQRFRCYGSTIESLQDAFRQLVIPCHHVEPVRKTRTASKRKTTLSPEQAKRYFDVIGLHQRGFSFEQIAEEMGMNSRQSTQQLYHRAVQAMAHIMVGRTQLSPAESPREDDWKDSDDHESV